MALETAPAIPGPAQPENSEAVATTPARTATRAPLLAGLFIGLFGVLLASFPARGTDLWGHLADGRDLLRGATGPAPTWLYDLATYAVFSLGGGGALAAAKALLCGAIAVLTFRLAGARGGWRIPLTVTGLAVLAMGNRLLLQPATVSVLFLAVALWLLDRDEARPPAASVWPGWRLVALFAVWANVDAWFVIGLAVTALTWLGRVLDDPPADGVWRALGRRLVAVAVLFAASCLSPAHVGGLRVPPELRTAVSALRAEAGAEPPTVYSPFDRDYLNLFRDSPAALSYYPLLALGLLSFLLNRKGWRWAWVLPWLALALVSAVQVRLVPFFAVLAGPVTAWNLRGFFARQGEPPSVRPWVRFAALGFTMLLAAAFLASAWTGWLQGPPFEPRRWVVEQPVALRQGAEFLQRSHADGLWPDGSRTLLVSPETAAAFAWFCPEDRALRDDAAVNHLLQPDAGEKARERLRELRAGRVVVHAGDPGAASIAVLDRLLADPDEWPVLHLTGGLVVFGWRDPARAGGPDPFAGREVDFARLAFRPDESEVAPPARTPRDRRWTDAFWKPAPPPRPAGRDEAAVLFRKAEALRQSAPRRHIAAWEAGQAAGLVGAAGGWLGAGAPADAALRLTLLSPPPPEAGPGGARLPPPITRTTFDLFQGFMLGRGDAPVGVLYAAVRAARRAVAENPNDASAYLVLGRAYLALLATTSELVWANQVPQLRRVRQVQATAALNRAVALNPKLAQAQLELGRLYLTLECLDLAVAHLRAYLDIPPRWGGPRKGDRESVESEVARLTKAVEREEREFAKEAEQLSVSERALAAARRGLVGQARDLLLKSDAAAFGAAGTELELTLLLRTGRPDDVLEWMTPEVRGSIGELPYQWFRAQALIAVGEYDEADAQMAEMVGSGGRLPPIPHVAKEVAGLVAKSLLDEQPGGFPLPPLAWRALGRPEFEGRIADIARSLGRRADMLVVRGLVALEAGNIDRARESFRAALAFSPDRWGDGQLAFNGRRVAWECLALVGP